MPFKSQSEKELRKHVVICAGADQRADILPIDLWFSSASESYHCTMSPTLNSTTLALLSKLSFCRSARWSEIRCAFQRNVSANTKWMSTSAGVVRLASD